MIYDNKIINNRQFKSSQSALEFSDSLPQSSVSTTALHKSLSPAMAPFITIQVTALNPTRILLPALYTAHRLPFPLTSL